VARGKPIRLGEVVFPTKKAATERIGGVLYAYPPGQTLSVGDGAFMRDVLPLRSTLASAAAACTDSHASGSDARFTPLC